MIAPKKAVQKMQPYNPPLEGRRNYLRLDFNENTVGPGKEVIKAIKKARSSDLCTYPEYNKFKKKLSEYLDINATELAITSASDEAIKLIIDTYMEKNEEIIIPVPTFPMFKFYSELAGVRIKEITYNEGLSFPADKVIAAINKKTKIIVIVNPNNPTGTPIMDEAIFRILKKAKNSIVILDEAYYQFSGNSLKKYINKYDNLVIIQTFSKAFGLAGLRLGYIISNKENIRSLSKASSPYSVNNLAIIAASKALEKDNYVKKYIREVNEAKVILKNALKKMKVKFYGSKTNFMLINFGDHAKIIEKRLRKKGILVRDQSDKTMLKGYIRITIGTKKQMIKFIRALKEAGVK